MQKGHFSNNRLSITFNLYDEQTLPPFLQFCKIIVTKTFKRCNWVSFYLVLSLCCLPRGGNPNLEEKEDAIKTVSLEFYGFAIKRQKDRSSDASGGYKIFLLLELFVVSVVF